MTVTVHLILPVQVDLVGQVPICVQRLVVGPVMVFAMMVERAQVMVFVHSERTVLIVVVDHRVRIPVLMPMMEPVMIMNWVKGVIVTAEPIVRTVVLVWLRTAGRARQGLIVQVGSVAGRNAVVQKGNRWVAPRAMRAGTAALAAVNTRCRPVSALVY